MAPQTATQTDWEGQPMLDPSGRKIGTIEEIYLVEETGRPEWALVKVGAIAGRATLVPLSGARPDRDGIRAAYEKSVVSDAPRIDGEPSDEEIAAVYRHYGVDGAATADGDGDGAAASARGAHEQPAGRSGDPRGDSSARSLGATLKRRVKEFSDDDLTHWAAALTYYGILSIFPALLALVAVLGLLGANAIQPLMDNLGSVAPGPAKDIMTSALKGLQSSGGGASVLFVVSLAGAVWSASGYISGFMDASNAIYDVEEGRPILVKLPVRIGITVVMLVLLTVSAFAVVLTGPVAEQAGKLFGVGS